MGRHLTLRVPRTGDANRKRFALKALKNEARRQGTVEDVGFFVVNLRLSDCNADI